MHARADMGSRERADMDLESRAISARVTKQIVTIFSKACDKPIYLARISEQMKWRGSPEPFHLFTFRA